jgi:hypothetical protein
MNIKDLVYLAQQLYGSAKSPGIGMENRANVIDNSMMVEPNKYQGGIFDFIFKKKKEREKAIKDLLAQDAIASVRG